MNLNIKEKINDAIKNVLNNSVYTKDNLLSFSVAGHPNFLVWMASLTLQNDIPSKVKTLLLENTKEEFFGLMGEGCHALLSKQFFSQAGEITINHHTKTRNEIHEIYKNLANYEIMLCFLTCIEIWSAHAMPLIFDSMQAIGATDFFYIDVHKIADNQNDGHSVGFLNALQLSNPATNNFEKGIELFNALFLKIFN